MATFGERVRRGRSERRWSQKRLAEEVGVSQPLISYYERALLDPPKEVRSRLAQVLTLEEDDDELVYMAVDGALLTADFGLFRDQLLGQIPRRLGKVAVFDRPATTGGDVAFAIDQESHCWLGLVDGVGSGHEAAFRAHLLVAALQGGLLCRRGVAAPEDAVCAALAYGNEVERDGTPLGGIVLARLDRAERVLRIARVRAPPPFIRNGGRTSHVPGKPHPELRVDIHVEELQDDALVVVATDGVAHRLRKGGTCLWDSPELRTAIHRAATPADVTSEIERRLDRQVGGQGEPDDALAVAWCP